MILIPFRTRSGQTQSDIPLALNRRLAPRIAAALAGTALVTVAFAASDLKPAPEGSFPNAPAQYTKFSPSELTRGFMALAFGSDLRVGARPRGVRRFDRPIKLRILSSGSIDRSARMQSIVEEYARKVPALRVRVAARHEPADIEVRLIDERKFRSAIFSAFGAQIARTFIARTDPQCMTSVKSNPDGRIVRSVSFIIVDKGEDIFLDCAYHELLHAFGLSNHDQRNQWTTLNQNRLVGYLTEYDRILLTLLYDPRVRPGLTPARARSLLPRVISDLELGASDN